MPTPHGSRGGMAFSADELRVLRRALAEALHTTAPDAAPPPEGNTGWAQDIRDYARLAESLEQAVHEGGRLRAFMVADLRRYRDALPGSAHGYMTSLKTALDDGYLPVADDLQALRSLRALPCSPAEHERRTQLLRRCEDLANHRAHTEPGNRRRPLALSAVPLFGATGVHASRALDVLFAATPSVEAARPRVEERDDHQLGHSAESTANAGQGLGAGQPRRNGRPAGERDNPGHPLGYQETSQDAAAHRQPRNQREYQQEQWEQQSGAGVAGTATRTHLHAVRDSNQEQESGGERGRERPEQPSRPERPAQPEQPAHPPKPSGQPPRPKPAKPAPPPREPEPARQPEEPAEPGQPAPGEEPRQEPKESPKRRAPTPAEIWPPHRRKKPAPEKPNEPSERYECAMG